MTFVLSGALIIYGQTGKSPSVTFSDLGSLEIIYFVGLIYLMAGLLPDYAALAKTRFLLRPFGSLSRHPVYANLRGLTAVIADLLLVPRN